MENLYSASEIVKKLPGISTRQILDLAEKGLIRPARESTGPGSPRLYTFENIFEICICLSLRGKLPPSGKTIKIIANILAEVKRSQEMWSADGINPSHAGNIDFLYIAYNDDGEISIIPMMESQTVPLKHLFTTFSAKKYKPQQYCTYLLEVASLREFLEDMFK